MLPKSLTYLTLIIFVLISACKKSSPPTSLPSITQEGKNTFGCLINGKVFTPKKRFNSYDNLRANYSTIDRGTFNMSAPRSDGVNGEAVFFRSKGLMLAEGQTYKLGGDGINGVMFASYLKTVNFNSTRYDSKDDISGEIIITKLTSKIISGTFSFDAVSSDGVKVEIREGRFDLTL